MERRFLYLYTSDRYNGEDAGEYSILESILAQEVTEEEQAVGNFATSAVSGSGESSGSGRGGSPAVAGSPRILTGGAPSTESPESPMLPSTEVPKFSHAGYDGGVTVGFQGEWDKKKFSRLLLLVLIFVFAVSATYGQNPPMQVDVKPLVNFDKFFDSFRPHIQYIFEKYWGWALGLFAAWCVFQYLILMLEDKMGQIKLERRIEQQVQAEEMRARVREKLHQRNGQSCPAGLHLPGDDL